MKPNTVYVLVPRIVGCAQRVAHSQLRSPAHDTQVSDRHTIGGVARRGRRRAQLHAGLVGAGAVAAVGLGWIAVSIVGAGATAVMFARSRTGGYRSVVENPETRALLAATGARTEPAPLPSATLVK